MHADTNYFSSLADAAGTTLYSDTKSKKKKKRRTEQRRIALDPTTRMAVAVAPVAGAGEGPTAPLLAAAATGAGAGEGLAAPLLVGRDIDRAAGAGAAAATPEDALPAAYAALGLDASQTEFLKIFFADMKKEYPELLEAFAGLKDPSALPETPPDLEQRSCFIKFLLKHENALKILLGYVTTAWPILAQYIFPPFDTPGIPSRELADVFSACGVFVNVGLTGVIAGPVFANAIIAVLKFIKKAAIDGKPLEALAETMEYWTPKEWTREHAAYLEEQAKREGRWAVSSALIKAISLAMPIARVGAAGAAAYFSWILSKALALGSLKAEADTCFPFELMPTFNQITFWWIVLANAITYGKDATAAAVKMIDFTYTPDEAAAAHLKATAEGVRSMKVHEELQDMVRPALGNWVAMSFKDIEKALTIFEAKFAEKLTLTEETSADTFKNNFREFIETIISNDSEAEIDAAASDWTRLRLSPEMLEEKLNQILAARDLAPAKKLAFFNAALEVLNEREINAALLVGAKKRKEEDFRKLSELMARFPTAKWEAALAPWRTLVLWPGAVVTSLVFALAVVDFIQSETGAGLPSALGAASIVGYFSRVVFEQAAMQVTNTVLSLARTCGQNNVEMLAQIASLALGLTTAGFSGGSAMFQAGSGALSEEYITIALKLLTFDQLSLVKLVSALNAAVVNSYGAVQLYEMILKQCGAAVANAVKCCFPSEVGEADEAVVESTSWWCCSRRRGAAGASAAGAATADAPALAAAGGAGAPLDALRATSASTGRGQRRRSSSAAAAAAIAAAAALDGGGGSAPVQVDSNPLAVTAVVHPGVADAGVAGAASISGDGVDKSTIAEPRR